MRPESANLRADTQALTALIEKVVDQARQKTGGQPSDTLLFMGNWHQAIPALVVRDPVLEPVDKLVWMVIQLQARETGGKAAFPCYETIAETANIRSTSTVSRAIAILRITRWLSLCARVRDGQGQFRGNVYALHDEPLPLSDALYLDSDYMPFVSRSTSHHHARVCRVAQGVLESLDETIRGGVDLTQPVSTIERRAVRALLNPPKLTTGYFALTAGVVKRLNNRDITSEQHRDQNSKAVESGFPGSSCSSDFQKNTTTTTTVTAEKADDQAKITTTCVPLIYPRRLSDNQKALAARYLATVEAPQRQALLDELQGRIASESRGMAPLYDELRFLYALCHAANRGEFTPNLGIKVRESRAQHQSDQPPQRHNQLSLLDETPHKAKSSTTPQGEKQLNRLKRSLGLSTEKPRHSPS